MRTSPPAESLTVTLACSPSSLDLDRTLESGQAFRWRRDSERWWVACLEPSHTVIRFRQVNDALEIEAHGSEIDPVVLVRDYFQLDIDMKPIEREWARTCGSDFAMSLVAFEGLRVLRQDPVECLFSFLMSPAAPIFRIMRCMEGLCRVLGDFAGSVNGVDLYAFPAIEALADAPRSLFDELGFGFRGGNIRVAARQVLDNGGADWVRGLRAVSYADAKASLVTLKGVGEKVADCVCLFSLDKHDAVPIDVHIARAARRIFDDIPATLTPKSYTLIGDKYRERFGPMAGWAQQYIYYNEIASAGMWDDDLGKHRAGIGRDG